MKDLGKIVFNEEECGMRKMELVKKITVAMLAAALITDLSLAGGGMPVLAEDEEVVEEVFVDDSEEVVDEYEEEEDIEYEEEEELELSKEKLNLAVGASATLEVDGDYDEITWSSSKTNVAKVNSNGKVTAKKSGTAVISAKVTCTVYNEDDAESSDEFAYFEESVADDAVVEDDGAVTDVETEETWDEETTGETVSYTLKCKVKVKKGAVLSDDKITLKVGKTSKLKVTGAKGKVTWASSKNKIATVKNGTVKGIKKGNSVITAKIKGETLKCKVKVK